MHSLKLMQFSCFEFRVREKKKNQECINHEQKFEE